MDGQRLPQFFKDIVEATRLDARARGPRIPVHWIALPDDGATELAPLDDADVRREQLPHARRAIPRYQRHFPGLSRRVQSAQEPQEVRRVRRRPDFHADRIRDPPEELDVCVVQLPRAVAYPEEVRRRVVVFLLRPAVVIGASRWLLVVRRGRHFHQSRQTLFILEQETLVACEQVDGIKLVALVCTDSVHEADHVLKEAHCRRVFSF